MTTAVTATDLEPFTPASLANVAAPPVFILRPATGRTLRDYRRALRAEGLQYHPAEAFRAQITLALAELWSAEVYDAQVARLSAYWAALDQNADVEPGEAAAIVALLEEVSRNWPRLRAMSADNLQFGEDSMKIALSMFVAGWSNVDVPYRRAGGVVPLDTIDQVETALSKAETRAIAAQVEGAGPESRAFIELCNAASARLNLDADTEKNSPSPSPSSPDPSGSTTTPSGRTEDVGSMASENLTAARPD